MSEQNTGFLVKLLLHLYKMQQTTLAVQLKQIQNNTSTHAI